MAAAAGHEILPARLEPVIRALLRQTAAEWPADLGEEEIDGFLSFAATQGIQPLLYVTASRSGGVPPRVLEALHHAVLHETARETQRARLLATIIAAAEEAGASPLIIKGSALAYSHYQSPVLRPRSDHDILIREDELPRLDAALDARGFQRLVAIESDTLFSQRTYRQRDGAFPLDVHWRISNLRVVADPFPFDELEKAAIEIDAGTVSFRAPAPADALLIAAVHRLAHHPGADRLIWLADLHLLFERMSPEEEERLWALAERRKVLSISRDGLNHAAGWFGTRAPRGHPWPLPVSRSEPSSALLSTGRTHLRDARLQWRWGGGWAFRARFLWDRMFPGADYLVKREGASSRLLLPYLILRRLVRGLRKLLIGR